MLRVDDGGAGETLGLVAGLEVDLCFVTAPRAVRDADDRLTARGNAQAHWHVDIVDEVLLRVVLDRGRVPETRERDVSELCSRAAGCGFLENGATEHPGWSSALLLDT